MSELNTVFTRQKVEQLNYVKVLKAQMILRWATVVGRTFLFVPLIAGIIMIKIAYDSEDVFWQGILGGLGTELIGLFVTLILIDVLWSKWRSQTNELYRYASAVSDQWVKSLTEKEREIYEIVFPPPNRFSLLNILNVAVLFQEISSFYLKFRQNNQAYGAALQSLMEKLRSEWLEDQTPPEENEIAQLRREVQAQSQLIAQLIERLER